MINLQVPLTDIDQRKIYTDCAGDFRDKTALSYWEKAVESADNYEKYVPKDIAHFPVYNIDKDDAEKIKNVYYEKFAKQDTVGRHYYEAIKANAKGRCPICGGGKTVHLDHFLPISIYPLLCVTPANLIPECRDCNMDKKDSFNKDYYSLTFNPYFDVMNDQWLECEVIFNSDHTCEPIFYNGYDKAQNPLMWKKYETHLIVHGLNDTFKPKAVEDIENSKYQYQNQLRECGEESIKNSLLDIKESCEHSDLNSWKAALYRELVKNVHNYCIWLDGLVL